MIEAYASQLKQTTDGLRDVGHPILDRQLVLNLLNGLNPRLANTADIIANTRPLPSFTEAVNMLRLKELCLANDSKVSSNTALAASMTAACTSTSCHSSSSPASQPRGGGKGRGGRGNNGGGGRKQQQQSGQGSQAGSRPGPKAHSSSGALPWRPFRRHILPSRRRRSRPLRLRPPATLRQVAGTRRVSSPP